jgi:hypothetical protein
LEKEKKKVEEDETRLIGYWTRGIFYLNGRRKTGLIRE